MRNGNDMVIDMAPPPEQFNMVNMSQHQQSNMNNIPPPSYSEVMLDTVPEPQDSKKLDMIVKASYNHVEFGPEPLKLTCWSCHKRVRL